MTTFYCVIAIISIFLIVISVKSQPAPRTNLPKLFVVSYDGFRYDYFQRNVTPYLEELKTKGIYADYMIDAFPSKTLPNHHTMATGLYVESHGVVDGQFYDLDSNREFKYSYELFHYNNDTMPIYILNEKSGQGRRSGMETWPGGEFEYGGRKATFTRKWQPNIPFTDRIDEIISWFTHPETPINLAMVYIEDPDRPAHYISFNNDRFDQILNQVDNLTRYIHKKLNDSGLSDVNVIHAGDHGMGSVTLNRIIDINKYVNLTDYNSVGASGMMNIFPILGKEQSVYENFQRAAKETNGFDVYWKRDVPKRFHYNNNPRIGTIIALCKIGYAFEKVKKEIAIAEQEFHVKFDEKTELGLHGYDNLAPEMYTIFFGMGPAFLPKCKIQPFNNVDLFSLFCDILEIPQLHSNGTLDVFKECLRKYHT